MRLSLGGPAPDEAIGRNILPKARLLDPREREAAIGKPILDAANLPLSELARRLHELPPKREAVWVAADGELAQATIELLAGSGRTAQVADFIFYDAPISTQARLWEPNAQLAGFLDGRNPGRALDLGCGTGRDAIYLAAAGWHVLAVDRLPEALGRGAGSAKALLGQDSQHIEWRCADLNRDFSLDVPAATFDLAIVFFVLSPRAVKLAVSALCPGGTLLLETFTRIHLVSHGKSSHAIDPCEMERMLSPLDIVRHEEGWHSGRHTLRIEARAKPAS